jgi:hypothetical protein
MLAIRGGPWGGSMGIWSGALERVSSFLPTSIKEPEELATYTAGLFGLCVILLGFGFVVILVAPFLRETLAGGIATFVVTLLSALMCLSVGAILGLMFGIPRYSKLSEVDNAVAPNNNLEQISDWLTKMIVGISLVQFDVIVAKTKVLALQITTAMSGCDGNCGGNYAMGLAVVGFFSASGFLMMYLWARVYLLLDVGTVQLKIDRDAVSFKDFLKNPERIQGRQRHRDLGKKAAEAGGAMNLAPGVEFKPGLDADDPWKGAFGGNSRDDASGRELVAVVKPLARPKDYCSVRLIVRSIDPAKPLTGAVKFFLHDTFPQPIQSVQAKDDKAELEVVAWGAFTVGALADAGVTKLELDLSKVEGVSADWRAR